jgi:hypothetical protein
MNAFELSEHIAASLDEDQLQPGGVRLIVLELRRTYHWTDIDVAVRDLSYAPDGDILGFVTADGSTWLYSMTKDAWSYSNDARTDTFQGRFSPTVGSLPQPTSTATLSSGTSLRAFRPQTLRTPYHSNHTLGEISEEG